jgi:hypothetical protein
MELAAIVHSIALESSFEVETSKIPNRFRNRISDPKT